MQSAGNDKRSAGAERPRLWAVSLGAAAVAGAIYGCQAPAPEVPENAATGPAADSQSAAEDAAVAGAPTSALVTGPGPGPGPSPAAGPPRVEVKRDGPHGSMKMAEQLKQMAELVPGGAPGGPPAGVEPGFWAAIVPRDNQLDAKRIALGKKLYFDARLSRDGTVACATCHDVSRGFTDRRNASEGIGGKVGRRNAPTTLNAAFFQTQFWDGRAGTLEEQAKLPITNPIEMGQPDGASAVKAIAGDAEYKSMFQAAYARDPNFDDVGRAIAAFERTLVFLDAPYDKFVAGQANALSADERAGWVLFNGKARCVSCHHFNGSSPIGTNQKFHNIGVSARHQNFEELAQKALAALAKSDSAETMDRLALETDLSELGRFVVTRNRSDIGAFKTQQIRNIGVTSPYMHDGSMQTLWDVVDHYNKGGEANGFLDGGIEPLNLNEREIDQLVAFLFALTDVRFAAENSAELARQRAVARDKRPFRDEARATRKVFIYETRLGKPGAAK